MPKPRALRITRFTVMATLQAARVRRLGFSEPSAYSWGLNRAIFYAAAKRGFGGRSPGGAGVGTGSGTAPANLYSIGNDEAYRDPASPELLFTIGGETQTAEAFLKQVAARFGSPENFRRAWTQAEETVAGFDETVLRSGGRFYSEVYKPRRDDLVTKWSEEFLGIAPGTPSPPARTRPTRASRAPRAPP
ncbi:MAG TPA: hypothetical protein VGU43_05545 [Thermoplasmata archaeon]|nr:hypothetical protein [Thermoplasmata archaeon]